MAGFYTDYWAKKLLEYTFGQVTVPTLGALYCGVSTTAPARDGTGFTEPSAGAYARVGLSNNLSNFLSASGSPPADHNAVDITFPTATANWGTIVWGAWFDASSAGNMICAGPLTSPITINSGATLKFNLTTGFTGSQA